MLALGYNNLTEFRENYSSLFPLTPSFQEYQFVDKQKQLDMAAENVGKIVQTLEVNSFLKLMNTSTCSYIHVYMFIKILLNLDLFFIT